MEVVTLVDYLRGVRGLHENERDCRAALIDALYPSPALVARSTTGTSRTGSSTNIAGVGITARVASIPWRTGGGSIGVSAARCSAHRGRAVGQGTRGPARAGIARANGRISGVFGSGRALVVATSAQQ
jgi:hypothetical protein